PSPATQETLPIAIRFGQSHSIGFAFTSAKHTISKRDALLARASIFVPWPFPAFWECRPFFLPAARCCASRNFLSNWSVLVGIRVQTFTRMDCDRASPSGSRVLGLLRRVAPDRARALPHGPVGSSRSRSHQRTPGRARPRWRPTGSAAYLE